MILPSLTWSFRGSSDLSTIEFSGFTLLVSNLFSCSTNFNIDARSFDKESKYYDSKSDQKSPRWILVDVMFKADLKQFVSLESIKANPKLSEMRILQKGNRLSITPVTQAEFLAIQKAGLDQI